MTTKAESDKWRKQYGLPGTDGVFVRQDVPKGLAQLASKGRFRVLRFDFNQDRKTQAFTRVDVLLLSLDGQYAINFTFSSDRNVPNKGVHLRGVRSLRLDRLTPRQIDDKLYRDPREQQRGEAFFMLDGSNIRSMKNMAKVLRSTLSTPAEQQFASMRSGAAKGRDTVTFWESALRVGKGDTTPKGPIPIMEMAAAPTPAKKKRTTKKRMTFADARAALMKAARENGWTAKVGAKTYLTHPSGTYRVVLKKQGLYSQDMPKSGKWTDARDRTIYEDMRKLAENADETFKDWDRLARDRKKAFTPTEKKEAKARTEGEGAPKLDPLVLFYSRSSGILLGGDTKAAKDGIKAVTKPRRFRYSRRLPSGYSWYVPNTREKFIPREAIEGLADALVEKTGRKVKVEYLAMDSNKVEPTPEKETVRRAFSEDPMKAINKAGDTVFVRFIAGPNQQLSKDFEGRMSGGALIQWGADHFEKLNLYDAAPGVRARYFHLLEELSDILRTGVTRRGISRAVKDKLGTIRSAKEEKARAERVKTLKARGELRGPTLKRKAAAKERRALQKKALGVDCSKLADLFRGSVSNLARDAVSDKYNERTGEFLDDREVTERAVNYTYAAVYRGMQGLAAAERGSMVKSASAGTKARTDVRRRLSQAKTALGKVGVQIEFDDPFTYRGGTGVLSTDVVKGKGRIEKFEVDMVKAIYHFILKKATEAVPGTVVKTMHDCALDEASGKYRRRIGKYAEHKRQVEAIKQSDLFAKAAPKPKATAKYEVTKSGHIDPKPAARRKRIETEIRRTLMRRGVFTNKQEAKFQAEEMVPSPAEMKKIKNEKDEKAYAKKIVDKLFPASVKVTMEDATKRGERIRVQADTTYYLGPRVPPEETHVLKVTADKVLHKSTSGEGRIVETQRWIFEDMATEGARKQLQRLEGYKNLPWARAEVKRLRALLAGKKVPTRTESEKKRAPKGFMRLRMPSLTKQGDWREYIEQFPGGPRHTGTDPRAMLGKVVMTKKLSSREYDDFIENFLADQPWLKGKGGSADVPGEDRRPGVEVVKVTAVGRRPVYINPEGYNYARYVLFEEGTDAKWTPKKPGAKKAPSKPKKAPSKARKAPSKKKAAKRKRAAKTAEASAEAVYEYLRRTPATDIQIAKTFGISKNMAGKLRRALKKRVMRVGVKACNTQYAAVDPVKGSNADRMLKAKVECKMPRVKAGGTRKAASTKKVKKGGTRKKRIVMVGGTAYEM